MADGMRRIGFGGVVNDNASIFFRIRRFLVVHFRSRGSYVACTPGYFVIARFLFFFSVFTFVWSEEVVKFAFLVILSTFTTIFF
uniref:Transmembrane protein n=1 Tax=Oryza brachyantha TaxID=4533 RepID=J3LET4_ORYBR